MPIPTSHTANHPATSIRNGQGSSTIPKVVLLPELRKGALPMNPADRNEPTPRLTIICGAPK